MTEYSNRRLSQPQPGKLFTGLILSEDILVDDLKKALAGHFGPIDLESPVHAFDHTDYYRAEMGPGLRRGFLSFEHLIAPDQLADIKRFTNRLEIQWGRIQGQRIARRINIDPGLLTLSNLILATTKNRAHRIYLSNGIYAEVTLIYSKTRGWQSLDWTYPDYQTPVVMEFFRKMRDIYYLRIRDRLRS